MPVGLGPVGKGYSESMVPSQIGERANTGGGKIQTSFPFLAPHIGPRFTPKRS